MSPVRIASIVVLVAAALALLASAPAGAAVRYAAPIAGVVEPCNPTPCSLTKAVSGAKAGDQVILTTGKYLSGADLLLNKPISVGGEVGAGTSIAFSGDKAALVENAGAVLHDLTLSHKNETMQYALVLESGTAERLYVDGRNGSTCFMQAGVLRDAVCFEGLFVAATNPGVSQATLLNVAGNPLVAGAFGAGAKMNATLVNSIVLGNDGGPGDLEIDSGPGATTSVVATNSVYAGVDTSLSAGEDFSFTPAGAGTNLTAAAQLVDAANGDFHPLASSPTVDAGAQDALLGPFDLAGGQRSQPRCIGGTPVPDIGPYEFVPTVDCPGSPSPQPTAEAQHPRPAPKLIPGRVHFGKLSRNLKKGTATLSLQLSGAGAVTMAGKGVVARTARATRARTVKVVVKARGAKLAKLRRGGKVGLRPSIVFSPDGGAPVVVVRPVTLKLSTE